MQLILHKAAALIAMMLLTCYTFYELMHTTKKYINYEQNVNKQKHTQL
jgi:hypothetical protein